MGRKSERELEASLRVALSHWEDGAALAESSFARNPGIEVIAEARYPGLGALSRGLVLRDLIRECLTDLAESLKGVEPLQSIVRGRLRGATQAEIARSINMSQEWLSRRYKRLLVVLVLDALQSRLRSIRSAAIEKAA